jgi:transposase
LRLPPYHCIFNPIELGANAVKIWKEAVTHVTPTMWNNSVEHVNKIIKTWWERELICDRDEIAPLIINIGEDSANSHLSS